MNDDLRIQGIRPQRIEVDPRQMIPAKPASSEGGSDSFKTMLMESMGEVQRLQGEADSTIRQLVSGEIKDVAEVMVAVEKADMSFQTMMAVRNKMVAAYEEIMRMQV